MGEKTGITAFPRFGPSLLSYPPHLKEFGT